MTNNQFSTLNLTPHMLKTVESLGYVEMTPIQAKVLPCILDQKDIIAQAKTGSGKTAAFGIGLLEKLDLEESQIQTLVLCPTRELADQVSQEIRKLARLIPNVRILTLFGGKSLRQQALSLANGAHIVVGTVGRVLDHIGKGTLVLDKVKTLVLDEADRMLDMGFEEDLTKIVKKLPSERQTLLFSATYPPEIQAMCKVILRNPVEIRLESIHEENTISQVFFVINKQDRNGALLSLLRHYKPGSVIIFCNTKVKCKEVENLLRASGFVALALHGDLDQPERSKILIQFENKSCTILVATDVAARGLDIEKIDAVINYELAHSAETHMHRVGRTGRAGHSGMALSLLQDNERYRMTAIEDYQKMPLLLKEVSSLKYSPEYVQNPPMKTLCISGGKKQKLRPGDIVGALTGDLGFELDNVGKIHITDFYSYVAISSHLAKSACQKLANGKIKNRNFKVQALS